ncbi:MAG: hypothetical protein KAG89_00750 [Fulvimarina manganoxydans]|uniref:hypothetical protein n=1 Tax=Fulvimarina manganoxydans TaxID=937218 RepID=UPI002355654E|nr:hypothetical protein [Fulvimarina manganoxydans]MCK5930675.1 hypothetical protein [Fulvimarina manganoxydans]
MATDTIEGDDRSGLNTARRCSPFHGTLIGTERSIALDAAVREIDHFTSSDTCQGHKRKLVWIISVHADDRDITFIESHVSHPTGLLRQSCCFGYESDFFDAPENDIANSGAAALFAFLCQ